MFGIGPDEDNRSYEERLDELYERFEKVVAKYDKKHNSELLDLSNEITSETASVYTEIGLQAGFLLMKDMSEEKSEPVKVSWEDSTVNHANKTLLEGMYKERVEKSLQEILCKDKKYQKVNEETRQKIKDIDKIELSKDEWEIIDRALSATNEGSAEYGRVAYRQGFLDAVSLLRK